MTNLDAAMTQDPTQATATIFRSKRGLWILVAIGIALLLSVIIPRTDSQPDVDGSSFSTGTAGLGAFAELASSLGHDVHQVRIPVSERAPDPSDTVIIADAFVFEDDEGMLRDFVEAGGRLILAGATSTLNIDGAPNRGDATPAMPIFPTVFTTGVATVAGGELAWRGTEAYLSIVANSNGSLAALRVTGDGEIITLPTAVALTNESIGDEDNAVFAANLLDGTEGEVWFLEYPHGFTRQRGLGALPRTWQWSLGALMVALMVWMITKARSMGPPESAERTLPPARALYVDALAAGLMSTRDIEGAAEPMRKRVLMLLERRGLDIEAPEAHATIAASLRLPIETVRCIQLPAQSTEDLEAVAAVLARLTRRTTVSV